ncbi:MAG TPA: hypothetical protein VGR00_08425 [Thermoanaerobaculia bacterium]|nr:hypothetical protein [Thermoanaerobaculia bacterium]
MKALARGLVVALALSRAASATVHGWVGPSSGGVWSNAANWDTGVPTSNEAGGTIVAFLTNVTSSQDIPGLIVDRILFFGTGNVVSATQPLTLRGTVLSPSIQDNVGGNAMNGSYVLSGTIANPVNVVVSSGTLALVATLSGSPGQLTFAGNVTLFATSTYSGATVVKSGLVTADSLTTNGAIPGNLTIGDGTGAADTATLRLVSSNVISNASVVSVGSDGRFDLDDRAETVAGLSDPAGDFGGNVTLGSASLTLAQAPGATLSFTGTISGTGGVTVTGNGTGLQRFGGNNTYTGITAASSGVLEVHGSQPASSVSVIAGTLSGGGTVGAVSSLNGTVNPGIVGTASTGALHVPTLSMAAGTTFKVLVGSLVNPPGDSVVATGAVQINGAALAVEKGAGAINPGDTYDVVIAAAGVSGTFAGQPNGSSVVASGQELRVNYGANTVTLTSCATAAPTVTAPAAATLLQSTCQ